MPWLVFCGPWAWETLVGFALLPAGDTRPEAHVPGALPNVTEHV